MAEYRLLSYPLEPGSPVWPGNPPAADVDPWQAIADGDVANTSLIRLFSHSGTHVDVPWHFNPAGPRASDLPISAYVFQRPLLLSVAADDGFIGRRSLEADDDLLADADIILMVTGWSRWRASDPERYVSDGPMLHPDAARFLLERAPSLRALAIDAISIGSPRHPAESVEVHQILSGTDRADSRFVLIYEDVRLDLSLTGIRRVYAWPLLAPDADGTPVTMVAEIDDHGR
jgi:arylformamidase